MRFPREEVGGSEKSRLRAGCCGSENNRLGGSEKSLLGGSEKSRLVLLLEHVTPGTAAQLPQRWPRTSLVVDGALATYARQDRTVSSRGRSQSVF